jgi:hypothetical protein
MVMEIMGNMVIMPLIDGNHFDFQRMDDKVKDGLFRTSKVLSDV